MKFLSINVYVCVDWWGLWRAEGTGREGDFAQGCGCGLAFIFIPGGFSWRAMGSPGGEVKFSKATPSVVS